MKRILSVFVSAMFAGMLFAGGIVTNQNQSAMYTRMQARDATLGYDAVFYNPAGLTLLPSNGLFISLNNQFITQDRTVSSDYEALNNFTYKGDVTAPLFPGLYMGYKLNNWAFSFGFNPVGGGGSGTYKTGLPSFEYNIADLAPALELQGQDARGYRMEAYFEGTSAFFGYQGNVSYKINDMIQVAAGVRYVNAVEKYTGYLRSIELDMAGTWIPASSVFTGISDQFRPGLDGTTQIVDGGGGSLTFADAEALGAIDATTRAQLEGGLQAIDPTVDLTTITMSEAQSMYGATVAKYDGTAYILQDQEADYEKTATGITPILSVNINPNDKFNIALKYEFNTALEFTNKTTKDFTTGFDPVTGSPITEFPNGEKSNLDIPALLSAGVTYSPTKSLLLSTGFHYYFDKNANWDGREEHLESNSWEFALGAEYKFSDKFLASIGYLRTKSYGTDLYQTDLSHTLPSNTIGGGFAYQVIPMMDVNLSASYTIYDEGSRNFVHDFAQSGLPITVTETYEKPILIIALGLNFKFNATK